MPPQPCLLCGSATLRQGWCEACHAALPCYSMPMCPVCALPTPNGEVCGHCLNQPPHFARTCAAYRYAFPIDKMIQALKFSGKFQLAQPLAQALAQHIQHLPDCLIAMPLHKQRLRERGYNQSLLLAQQLGKHFHLPVLSTSCQRLRNTQTQSTLPWKERDKNLRNAFHCLPAVSGKHVAIVDDVMTSGSSVNELAKALLAAGAREVSVWVIARTLPDIR